MNNKKGTFIQRVKLFIKRNCYAVVVTSSVLVLTVALAITAVVRSKDLNNELGNIDPSDVGGGAFIESEATATEPVIFNYPVGEYTLGDTYQDSALVYNETLGEWATHQGIDFIVSKGTEVNAVYKGTVESIDYSTLDGKVIVIDHGEGLKSIYKSLSNEVAVEVGQTVEAGQVIGNASDSASSESSKGAHLHLEVEVDGQLVNPMNYLGEK